MQCKEENKALLYAYGELSDKDTASFLLHLKDCPSCQNIIRTCALTSAALEQKQAPSFDLSSAVNASSSISKGKVHNFGLINTLNPLFRRLVPVALMGALALMAGFGAMKYIEVKKPYSIIVAKTKIEYKTDIEEMDSDITTLETEIEDLFEYIGEI